MKLNEKNLEKVLLQTHIKDTPIVVVSVAGAFRKGKSFLLGFFLKYFDKQEEDWLREDDTIEGFEWSGGCEQVTSGIHIWSKPFIHVKETGERVAVLLMDTQGIFDDESTMKDYINIFSLSNLLSSVQIYNLTHQLQEDDLKNLEFFTAFSDHVKTASEESEDLDINKPRLVFLIRDWGHTSSYPFGLEGGNACIRKKLGDTRSSQPLEHKKLRKRIKSSFSNIEGFLLPYPGNVVARHEGFHGQIKEIDKDFVHHVKNFVTHVMSKDNIVTKTIDFREIKGGEWFNLVKELVNSLNSEDIPIPETVFSVVQTYLKKLDIDRACGFYDKKMTEFVNSYWWYHHVFPKTQPLRDHHEKTKTEAGKMFCKMRSMRKANNADRDVQIEKLGKAISAKYRDHLDALQERRSTVLAARQYVGYAAFAAGGAFLQSFAGNF
ncbi:atlastin-2-like [Crassostrea virginica]